MFLRANKRFKDGKEHRYWSVVENRRVAGGRSVQKTLLYLGEINDSDRAGWARAIEAVDERDGTRQIHLFPEDRTPDPSSNIPLSSSVSIISNSPVHANGAAAGSLWNSRTASISTPSGNRSCPTSKKARPGSRSSKPSPPIVC